MIDLYMLTPVQFEDLCYEYACEVYDENKYILYHTQYSHDGGKDIEINFYDKLHRYKIWAECKQHRENIGLEEIGKNIVLVIANNINKILFFSASNIRESAKVEILKISKRLNFLVEFLDGSSLVRELENYPFILKKYFSDYIQEDEDTIDIRQKLSFRIFVSENFQDDFLNESKDIVYLKNGKMFFVNLLIENKTSEYFTNFTVEFNNIPDNIELLEINDSQNIPNEIWPYSDTSVSYLCSVKNSLWEKIQLPDIEVSYMTPTNEYISIFVNLPLIDLSKYIIYQFSGKSYIEFIANEVTHGNVLSKAQIPQFYDIRGFSGTGKSRLLEEIKLASLRSDICVYQYDCNDYIELDIIKRIICDLLNLSPIYKNPEFNQKNFKIAMEQYSVNEECQNCLSEFLFSPASNILSYANIIFSIINIVRSQFPKKAILITIDNIQESTPSFINFVQQLIMEVANERLSLSLAIVINTEFIPEETTASCTKILHFLDNQLHKKNQFHKCECLGFSKDDRLLFWMQAFNRHIPDDQLILKLLNYFGDTPLELITACDYLKKNKILMEDTSGEWYVKKQNLLDELFENSIKDFDMLFDKRYRTFLQFQTKENQKKISDIIAAIVNFRNNMPPDFVLNYNIDIELIDLMVRNKILRIKPTENMFAFYHDSIYRYFASCVSRHLSSIDYKIISFLNNNDIDNKDFLLFFIYQRHGDFKRIKKYGLGLLKEKIKVFSYQEANEIGRALYDNERLKEESLDYYLECATLYAFSLSSNGNKNLSCKLFMELCPLVLKHQQELPSERVGEFYRDAVNAQLQCFYFEHAKTVIGYYKQAHLQDNKYRFLIHNREGVVYLSLNDYSKAMECFKNSLVFCKQMDNRFFWSSTTHSDIALLYFYGEPEKNNLDSCIKEFRIAIQEYNQSFDDTRFRKCEILWHHAFISILNSDYLAAEKSLEKALLIKSQQKEVYTIYRLNNLLSLVYLYTDRINEAERLLLAIKSICEVHHYDCGVIRVFNNLGIVYHIKNEANRADEYFSLSLKMLNQDILSLKLYPILSNNYLSAMQNNRERFDFVKNCVNQSHNKRLIQHCKNLSKNRKGFTFWDFDGFDYIF